MSQTAQTSSDRPTQHFSAKRIAIYLLGLLILTTGLTLNTKVTLGVSPILSVAYCVSEVSGMNFGDVTFFWFCIFVLVQVVLHLIRRGPNLKTQFIADCSQILVSLITTRFMNLLSLWIPVFEKEYPDSFLGSIGGRFLLLLLAIVLTGIGAALSLFMRVSPIPADGMVQGIADFTGKTTGFTKNCVDACCVLLTTVLSLVFAHRLVGIGIGTVTGMLGVGRVIAVVDKVFGKRLREIAG